MEEGAASAAAENGIEGDGYIVVKEAAEATEGDGAPAADVFGGGDRGDLAASADDAAPVGSEDAPAPAVTVTAAEDAAPVAPAKAQAKKGGSGDAAGDRKARPHNGKVPVANATTTAARGKKPGVLSQSASFPARGATATAATAKKVAAAVAATPKQAKGAAVANGSDAAAG